MHFGEARVTPQADEQHALHRSTQLYFRNELVPEGNMACCMYDHRKKDSMVGVSHKGVHMESRSAGIDTV